MICHLVGKKITFADVHAGIPGGKQFQGHPVQSIEEFQKFAVPLSLHGDGTPAMGAGKSWSKSIDVWSRHNTHQN